jgi:tetratricopeptide (TPR) repeat protein
MDTFPSNFIPVTEPFEKLFDKNEKYTFLAGAGISIDPPSNIPSARTMVKQLLNIFAVPEDVDELLKIDLLRYEMIVEQIQNFFDKDLKFLDYFELVKYPNIIHYFLASMIRLGQYVVTTNFDYMIERAFLLSVLQENSKDNILKRIQESNQLLAIITKKDFITYSNLENILKEKKHSIVKIHGSKKNIITQADTKESLVTTISALGKEREEGKTFAIEQYKKPLMTQIMDGRILVVIGYSGSDDFDISPLLKEFKNLKILIWVEHSTQPNIQTITYRIQPQQNIELELKNLTGSKKLLTELRNTVSYPIFFIHGNTADLISTSLIQIFSMQIEREKIISQAQVEEILSFEAWIHSIYKSVSEIEKYKMTAEIFRLISHPEQQLKTSKKGLEISKDSHDKKAISYFLNNIGLVYSSRGEYENALKNYTEAIKIDEELGDLYQKTIKINNIGVVYRAIGDYKTALIKFAEAMKIDEKLGNFSGMATYLTNIGGIYRTQGDYANAMKFYTEAVRIEEKLGDLNGKASILNNIGDIYSKQGDYANALMKYTETLKIVEQLGDLEGKTIALNNIGLVYHEKRDSVNSIKYYFEALKIAIQLGNISVKAIILNNLGGLCDIVGDYKNSLIFYTEAVKVNEQLGDQSGKATLLNNLGAVFEKQKDFDSALKNYNESLKIFEKLGENTNVKTVSENIDRLKEKFIKK